MSRVRVSLSSFEVQIDGDGPPAMRVAALEVEAEGEGAARLAADALRAGGAALGISAPAPELRLAKCNAPQRRRGRS